MQRGFPAHFSRATTGPGCALMLFVAGLVGCQPNDAPELLSVHRLDPGRAAVGDRLSVIGEGFPDGSGATVTFRGDLFRPGTAPERDVQIIAHAAQARRNVLELPLDTMLERRFVGRGDSAAHTTFRGELRVAFVPNGTGTTGTTGTAGISGTAKNVRFDVLPTASGGNAADPEPESPSAGAFLGIATNAEPARAGLRVTAIAPDGRAAAAGLRPGDVLLDFDGVTVLSEADLRARTGQETARVMVEREGRELPPLTLDVEGFAPLGAADLERSGAFLAVVSLALVLLATKIGVLLRWVPLAADSGFGKGGRPAPQDGWGVRAMRALLSPITEMRGLGLAALIVIGLVVLGIGRLATRHSLLSADLDLIAGALSASIALLCARFADGGVRGGGGWSLRAALVALAQSLACVAPTILGIGAAVLASGRFVIAEMVTDQGAAPWRWAAARNPGLLAVTVLLLASAGLESADRGPLAAAGLRSAGGPREATSRVLVRLAEWSYLWVISALTVLVLLGGWRLPGVSLLAEESSRGLCAAGAALVVAKVSVVVFGIGATRARLSRIFVEHVAPLWTKWALPGTLAAVVVAAAWGAAFDTARSVPLVDLCGMVSTALAGLAVGYFLLVATRPVLRTTTVAGVNPWL